MTEEIDRERWRKMEKEGREGDKRDKTRNQVARQSQLAHQLEPISQAIPFFFAELASLERDHFWWALYSIREWL